MLYMFLILLMNNVYHKQRELNVDQSYLRPGSNAMLMVCLDSVQYTAEEKASTRATAKSNFRV
jgi:hypothetical protein